MKRLSLLVTALAASMATPAIAEEGHLSKYFDCVVENAVELGAKNSEPTETILRVAYDQCKVHIIRYNQEWRMKYLEKGLTIDEYELRKTEEEWRRSAGDRATGELLRARAAHN